jgi:hypothetical protein
MQRREFREETQLHFRGFAPLCEAKSSMAEIVRRLLGAAIRDGLTSRQFRFTITETTETTKQVVGGHRSVETDNGTT